MKTFICVLFFLGLVAGSLATPNPTLATHNPSTQGAVTTLPSNTVQTVPTTAQTVPTNTAQTVPTNTGHDLLNTIHTASSNTAGVAPTTQMGEHPLPPLVTAEDQQKHDQVHAAVQNLEDPHASHKAMMAYIKEKATNPSKALYEAVRTGKEHLVLANEQTDPAKRTEMLQVWNTYLHFMLVNELPLVTKEHAAKVAAVFGPDFASTDKAVIDARIVALDALVLDLDPAKAAAGTTQAAAGTTQTAAGTTQTAAGTTQTAAGTTQTAGTPHTTQAAGTVTPPTPPPPTGAATTQATQAQGAQTQVAGQGTAAGALQPLKH